MSRRDAESRTDGPIEHRGRLRAYLTRFFTSWVAEDPEPTYSSLDLADGLDQDPDPVTHPRAQLPESPEVAHQTRTGDQHDDAVADQHDSAVAARRGGR